MTNESHSAQFLKTLGFQTETEVEAAIALKSAKIESGEALAELLPKRIIMLAPLLIPSDYLTNIPKVFSFPPDKQFIEDLHRFLVENFKWLPEHPHFKDALNLCKQPEGSGDKRDLTPTRDVNRLTSSPMLGGRQAPYMPLILLHALDNKNDTIFKDLFDWPDILFLSSSLLESLAAHVEGVQQLLNEDRLLRVNSTQLKEYFEKSRNSLNVIEGILCPPQKAEDESSP